MELINIIAHGSVANIDNLSEYEDDERIENINFRELAIAVLRKLIQQERNI